VLWFYVRFKGRKEQKEQQSKRAREKEEQGREGQKKFPIVTEVVKVRIDCRSQVLLWVEPFF